MSDNPYLRRMAKSIGKTGRVSEKRLTKSLGGRGRPASGAMAGAKGDIDLGGVLMEAKSTVNGSLGVKLDWLVKIAHEARSEHKVPALAVSFIRPDGKPVIDGEWVMVPRHVWEEHLCSG